jgi:hypothetical protein
MDSRPVFQRKIYVNFNKKVLYRDACIQDGKGKTFKSWTVDSRDKWDEPVSCTQYIPNGHMKSRHSFSLDKHNNNRLVFFSHWSGAMGDKCLSRHNIDGTCIHEASHTGHILLRTRNVCRIQSSQTWLYQSLNTLKPFNL